MGRTPRYLEIQLRRARDDLFVLVKQQFGGVVITLLGSLAVVPAAARLGGVSEMNQLGIILSTSLAGPVIVFVAAFAVFYFRAPGKLHGESVAGNVHIDNSPNALTASVIFVLFLFTLVAAAGFWIEKNNEAAHWRRKYGDVQKDGASAWWWARYWRKRAFAAAQPVAHPPIEMGAFVHRQPTSGAKPRFPIGCPKDSPVEGPLTEKNLPALSVSATPLRAQTDPPTVVPGYVSAQINPDNSLANATPKPGWHIIIYSPTPIARASIDSKQNINLKYENILDGDRTFIGGIDLLMKPKSMDDFKRETDYMKVTLTADNGQCFEEVLLINKRGF